jgi:hypothetical protein
MTTVPIDAEGLEALRELHYAVAQGAVWLVPAILIRLDAIRARQQKAIDDAHGGAHSLGHTISDTGYCWTCLEERRHAPR